MPVMLAMYGGGVVTIRETVRRGQHGWPSILLLGLAYAMMEEGIADQSLFNPNFLGHHMLAPGFIPALGIGVPWTIFVLGIHVIWSIAVPIALAESLFPDIRNEPWMGRIGLAIAALLYAGGVTLVTLYFAKTFFASPAQIAASATGIVVLAAVAFALPRMRPKSPGPAPSPWIVGLVSFIASFAFVLLYGQGVRHWPWQAASGGMVLVLAFLLWFAFAAGRRSGWKPLQTCALAGGALITYCWTGFFSEIALHGPTMLAVHAVLVAAMLVLLAVAGFKARSAV